MNNTRNIERIKILEASMANRGDMPISEIDYSSKLYIQIRAFLPTYCKILNKQEAFLELINKNNADYKNAFDKAKMYISHFITVLNLAIQRNEFAINIRKFYGLKISEDSVPPINTPEDLIKWGKNVIEGENKRTFLGGRQIYNPKMAIVEVYYNKFLELHVNQPELKERYKKCLEQVSTLHLKADKLIQQLFAQVSKSIHDLPIEQRNEKLKKYGFLPSQIKKEIDNYPIKLIA